MQKHILVINSGSTSLKYKLFSEVDLKLIRSGYIEHIGENEVKDHEQALGIVLEGIKEYKDDIVKIGHRVVHGGTKFIEPIEINESVLKDLENISKLAPLHNPANLMGIKAAMKLLPNVLNVAVFDTAFHQSIPERAWRYGISDKYVKKYGIRRYGFHGISHEYVSEKVKSQNSKVKSDKEKVKNLRIISCHLGGGCSVCAIENGKSVDISMGFTPLEGLMMMSRCGDIDPAVVTYLQKKENLTADQIEEILNFKSGILALCGETDWLKVLERVKKNEKIALIAFDIFVYRVKKYIGAYYSILGGLDVLIFTGSIGSGDPLTREAICNGLPFLKNVEIKAIETDEELMIASKIFNF
ncbi:MAG: acetate/propionate family kinase [Patescibacteria group bacterium]|nr:acetate/propionate family kinase [Patescibacteria group bacterium]